MLDLGKLAQKQIIKKIIDPSQMTDIMMGAEVNTPEGKKHAPGVLETLDYHSETLGAHEHSIAAMARFMKISPEKFSEFCSDVQANVDYFAKVRECEAKKSVVYKKKETEKAVKDIEKQFAKT